MNEPKMELVAAPRMEVARPEPTVADMLRAVVEKGVSAENVAAVEQLVKLYERMEDRKAEQAFAAAFSKLQSELSAVTAGCAVPGNDGGVRYRFADYDTIMQEVGPKLAANAFSVSFSTKFDEKRIIKLCTLTHAMGHSKTAEFAVRIGSGPPKASECQADGAASTYAKRFALCEMLNIRIDKDTDGRVEGGHITQEQANSLRARVNATETDSSKFLKYAGDASSFETIPSVMYNILDEFLAKRERLAKKGVA